MYSDVFVGLKHLYCCRDLCKAGPVSEGLCRAVSVSSVPVACDEAEATPFVHILVLAATAAPQLTSSAELPSLV